MSNKPPESADSSAVGAEALLRRLEWTVIRRLDGLLQGDYRTLWRGAGLDLADLREYQHGDDVRHIDWNVTARLQTPHVRQFTEDREMTAWFLLDLSGSVDFGSMDVTKLSVSAGFVAVLAGCDILLVCSKADAAARVHAALAERIASDGAFRARCEQAALRSLALRRARQPRPGTPAELSALLQGPVAALEAELARRLDGQA